LEDQIHPRKKFSRFLILILVLFEGFSLTLVMGLVYWMLSRSMTHDFFHKLQAQQMEVETILHERLSRLESRVRELSLNNAVRVSLMLKSKSQLREIMDQQYSNGQGAIWLVRGKDSDFVPGLPDRIKALGDFFTLLAQRKNPESVRFMDFGGTGFLSVFYAPIMRKDERLGSAFVIYDLSRDSAYWLRLGVYPDSQLLIGAEKKLVDLHTGRKYDIPKGLYKAFSTEKPAGSWLNLVPDKGILPLKGFPGIFYEAPSISLQKKKISLIFMLGLLCLAIFFLTFFVAIFLARKMIHPLEDISVQALDIAEKPTELFLSEEKIPYAEFQKLVRAFNKLLASLLHAHQKLKQRAEKKLDESEERYRKTLELIPFSVTIARIEDGRFLMINDAFCRITGYSKEEALGKTSLELNLFVNPSDRSEAIRSIKEKGQMNNAEIQFRRKDGSIFDGLHFGRPIRYENEDCLVVVFLDITDRKRAQKEKEDLEVQLRQAQKMEAVGTLAGGIAHDFNNLLQGILGYTQILLMQKEKSDPDSSRLEQIEKAARRASELTQQLLAFSRKVETKLSPVDLNDEVKQVRKLLERTIPKMIDIELHLQKKLWVVNADPAQLEQVMMNLGLNARDAMPEGGKLVFETENVALDEEYCKAHLGAKAGKYVLLRVSDTGIGMDKETVGHIFEPFFTTKETGKGTGLGLAMVYGIVKNHGGYIMCYSEPEEGTTFKIYFPVIESESEEDRSKVRKEDMPEGGHETILLVDDEEVLRDIGKEILENSGYTILLAPDGERALELYRERADDISLVILDLIMPGVGGNKCLEEILKINPEAKVVIASGYSPKGHAKDALESGARNFIRKPYELKQMLQVVREVMDAN